MWYLSGRAGQTSGLPLAVGPWLSPSPLVSLCVLSLCVLSALCFASALFSCLLGWGQAALAAAPTTGITWAEAHGLAPKTSVVVTTPF